MRYRVEGDYFFRYLEGDMDTVHAAVNRSKKAYNTKAHPEDKNEFTWITKRIKRVFNDQGTMVFPAKRREVLPR